MAVEDVRHYCRELGRQYEKMSNLSAKALDDYKHDKMSEEQFQKVMTSVNTIKENYSRVAYVMYLLDLPKNKKKKAKMGKKQPKIDNLFKMAKADEQSVLDENLNALNDIEDEIDEEVGEDQPSESHGDTE